MQRASRIRAEVLLLRGEGTPGLGLRIIAGLETAKFFDKVLSTWSDGSLMTAMSISRDRLKIHEGWDQEKHFIKLTDEGKKVVKRLFGAEDEIDRSSGWQVFSLTDGKPGLNIINPDGIKMFLHSLNAAIP
jgi:hypothetical protein